MSVCQLSRVVYRVFLEVLFKVFYCFFLVIYFETNNGNRVYVFKV